ncbi:MAG: metal-dependent transcriptional regulator [Chloroflexi bacterium]|nr:metal-dependent transcriptional regulator [Chloroflexota bacterium]MQC26760.1 metal-dependent transcriptional regulator [Chloroflexota bacterium]
MAKSKTIHARASLSQSIEDYLKAVYELTRGNGRATTNALAEHLDVAPASVTGMLQKLAETKPPLLEYQKHRGVRLTSEGERVALETIRHHRLLELFLHQILGYEWDEVHEEADRLEHVISERFEERIAAALGDPNLDPHGDPIPRPDLSLPDSSATLLRTLRPGETATVTRVRDTLPELLRHLSELGVVPGVSVHITEYSEFDGNLHLRLDQSPDEIVLGPRVTSQVFVEPHP